MDQVMRHIFQSSNAVNFQEKADLKKFQRKFPIFKCIPIELAFFLSFCFKQYAIMGNENVATRDAQSLFD